VTTLFCAYAAEHVPIPTAFATVQFTPVGVVVMVPPPAEPFAAAMVSCGGAVNCAVTARIVPVAIASVQVVPTQAPEYALKVASPLGVAVSVTVALAGNDVLHVPLSVPAVMVQLMPAGLLVITPVPVPAPVIVTPCVKNVASAVRGCDIVIWHGSVVQSPAHALNTPLPVGVWSNVTTVLIGNVAEHVPLDVLPFSVQLIPDGVLVITPPPDDPLPALTVRRCGAAVNAVDTAVVTLL
jgi:hypothetical protein